MRPGESFEIVAMDEPTDNLPCMMVERISDGQVFVIDFTQIKQVRNTQSIFDIVSPSVTENGIPQ